MAEKPLKAVIIGGGHRSLVYAQLALIEPEKIEITGVADPDRQRRAFIAEKFGVPEEHCFKTAQELAKAEKFADIAINGTMDDIHVATTIPLLAAGYDVLLEKPFAVNENEAKELVRAAKKYNRKVMVCFVLRYAPFYSGIKKKLCPAKSVK